ncbi:hypothetical protein FB446DRAFT_796852 [Lentinula raphanica]|nr:hypothetical protein FB446DRAFT_796852 [Lentinula raphanica]
MSKSVQDKLTRGAKLNFFLTGASGYIGLVVTEFAIAQDFSVRGLSRTEASDEKLRALGATPVRESAVADAVIHLAWNLDWLKWRPSTPSALPSRAQGSHWSSRLNARDGSDTDENSALRVGGHPVIAKRLRNEKNTTEKEGVHGVAIRLAAPYVYGRGWKGFLMMYIAQAVKLNES